MIEMMPSPMMFSLSALFAPDYWRFVSGSATSTWAAALRGLVDKIGEVSASTLLSCLKADTEVAMSRFLTLDCCL